MTDAARTLTVTLPPEAREVIEARVASGEFTSAEEAVTQAVYEWDGLRGEEIAEFRNGVERSLSDPRPSIPAAEAFTVLREHLARHRRGP